MLFHIGFNWLNIVALILLSDEVKNHLTFEIRKEEWNLDPKLKLCWLYFTISLLASFQPEDRQGKWLLGCHCAAQPKEQNFLFSWKILGVHGVTAGQLQPCVLEAQSFQGGTKINHASFGKKILSLSFKIRQLLEVLLILLLFHVFCSGSSYDDPKDWFLSH